jgi:recombination associated protein RdgC
MWFRQIQLFQAQTPIPFDATQLAQQLEPLAYRPCLPTFPSSHGWVSPLEEEGAPLVHAINGNMMICLQFEEKLLPATVVRQELADKVKEIESQYSRKVYSKEKLALKDEIIHTLLPRAFSKFSMLYAYIDTRNNWIVLNTTNAAKTEKFLELLKKSLSKNDIQPIKTDKIAPTLTRWVMRNDYSEIFSLEKSCVLIDPNKQSRVVRCQQQDLLSKNLQALIKEGYEVNQLALCWQDRIHFVLTNDASLRSIKYPEEVIAQAQELEPETKRQQFEADFLIMIETLAVLLKDLFGLLMSSPGEAQHNPGFADATPGLQQPEALAV